MAGRLAGVLVAGVSGVRPGGRPLGDLREQIGK